MFEVLFAKVEEKIKLEDAEKDICSFLTAEPSVYNIDAIEDSELLLISNSALEP